MEHTGQKQLEVQKDRLDKNKRVGIFALYAQTPTQTVFVAGVMLLSPSGFASPNG
jgi:hypothetical protein